MKAIDNLPDEDKVKISEKMKDLYKAGAERGIENTEFEKSDAKEPADEKEEVKEESEEIGKDVDEIEDIADEKTDEEKTPDEGVFEEKESARDEMAEENRDKVIHELTDKVNEIEKSLKELLSLRDAMEEFTKKQAESFGYKGDILGVKKDVKDMSLEELKARQAKGI